MSLKMAVLAMLDVEPGSGYGLLQRFKNSVGFFWQTTHQQLYKELHGLHEAGLVDCRDVPQEGRPDKKVYTLNPQGEAELDSMLAEAANPAKIRDPLLLKLFSGRRLEPAVLTAELAFHREQHASTLATYRTLHEQIGRMPEALRERYHFPAHTLRLGIMFEETWLRWCEEVMAELPPR
jgi:PadR family transcriptional regulator AphA